MSTDYTTYPLRREDFVSLSFLCSINLSSILCAHRIRNQQCAGQSYIIAMVRLKWYCSMLKFWKQTPVLWGVYWALEY